MIAFADQKNLDNKLFANWRFEFVYPAISGLLCLFIVSFVLNLFYIDWRVPFSVAGDAIGGLASAQIHIRGDARFFNIGIDISRLQFLKMWFLSLFINESGLLVNVFYILTFFTVGLTTTFALRLLRIRPILSILGGVIYCFLPFHFWRGTTHLFLSTYAIIPLVCVLALWICAGDLEFNKTHRTKTITAFIIIILLSMTATQLSFLAGMVLAFAVFLNFLEFRSLRKLIAPIVLCLTLVVIVILFLLPYFLHVADGGISPMQGNRSLRCAEIFALRFVELMLPVQGHRIPAFESFRSTYVSQVSLGAREGTFSSALGVFMSVGFIISIFIAVRSRTIPTVHNSAILNLFIFILGTLGGLASFIIFIFPYQRTYNRLSIFIAFYSLFIVLFLFEKFLDKLPDKLPNKLTKSRTYVVRLCSFILVIAVGTLALLDQIPATDGAVFMLYTRNQNRSNWNADRDFVAQVESITPDGSVVFQLPFIHSGHFGRHHEIGNYEHYRPHLHSKTLAWSYRTAGVGTDAEKWQRRVSDLPAEQLLRHIAVYGFRGVYIDTRGYLNYDAQILIDEIYKTTGIPPIISNHEFMYYFYIGDFADYVNYGLNDADKMVYLWEFYFEKPVVLPGVEISGAQHFLGTLHSGWSGLEQWGGVWSIGHTSELSFLVFPEDTSDLKLTFNLRAFPNPTYLSVHINEAFMGNYSLSIGEEITVTAPYQIFSEANIVDGAHEINVRFEIANPISPSELGISPDTRQLGIGLVWFKLDVLKP